MTRVSNFASTLLFAFAALFAFAGAPVPTASWATRFRPASRFSSTPRSAPDDRLRCRGHGRAHAGRLPARQQRHAVPDRVQPLRRHAGAGPVLRRPRLRHERAVGARLPGRPVRSGGRPDDPLEPGAHRGGQRRRPAPLHPCGARVHRRRARSTSSATAWASSLAREWLRQDGARDRLVRRLVAIDGPNHGIINCSPSPLNYWQAPASGGFTPTSAMCVELGSPDTPFLQRLNRGREAPLTAGRRAGDPQRRHELRLLPDAGRRFCLAFRRSIRSASRPTSPAARGCAARARSISLARASTTRSCRRRTSAS